MRSAPFAKKFLSAALSAVFGVSLIGAGAAFPVFARAETAKATVRFQDAAKDVGKKEPPKEDPEIRMGREAHEEMLKNGMKLVTDPALLARVETIGKKVAAIANKTVIPATYGKPNTTPFDYKFFIVDDNDINAFCIPGGYVYVNKGLLKYVQSDDELAGVLGHEVIHAAHHHIQKLQREQSKLNTQMAIAALAAIFARVPMNDTGNLVYGMQLVALQKLNGYGQDAERDADHGGIILSKGAGYNPVGMLTFMERLARDQRNRPNIEMGIFRTHPPEKERAESMISQINTMGLPIKRRETSNMLKVTIRSITKSQEGPGAPVVLGGNSEVLIDDKPFLKTSSPERAKEIAARLDALFDTDVQLFDIVRRGATILARGETLIAVAPTDTPLAAGSAATPDAIAESAYKSLRSALYRYVLEGVL